MARYAVFLRGINVGGKNKVPMAGLKKCLEDLGFSDVSTYIASGNVLLQSSKGAKATQSQIEKALPKCFKLDTELIKVLVLTQKKLEEVVAKRPKGFGGSPAKFHSDAVFLMDITSAKAMSVFNPKEGVDKIWAGSGVIYSQRLSSQRAKSRLSKIVGTPAYKSMTIRNWNTTTKLLELMNAKDKKVG